jgi:hypothetical protein
VLGLLSRSVPRVYVLFALVGFLVTGQNYDVGLSSPRWFVGYEDSFESYLVR